MPIPREQVLEPDDPGVGDTSQSVGKPGLRIDVGELGAHDQCGLERRAIGTAI